MNSKHSMPQIRLWSRPDFVLASVAMAVAAAVPPVAAMLAVDRSAAGRGVLVPLAVAGAAILVAVVLRLGRDHLMADALARRWHRHRIRAFDALMAASPATAGQDLPVVLAGRLTDGGAGRVEAAHVAGAMMDLAILPVAAGVMAWIAGPLALAPLAVAAVAGLALLGWGRMVDGTSQAGRQADERRWMLAAEALGGAHTVKGLGLEAQMQRRFERFAGAAAEHAVAWAGLAHRCRAWGAVVPVAAVMATLLAAALADLPAPPTTAQMVACVGLAALAAWPVGAVVGRWPLLRQWHQMHRALNGIAGLPAEAGGEERPLRPTLAGRIVVEGLSVGFGAGQPDVLRDVSLVVEPGEAVAITGDSASGKSTLLAAILGLVEPRSGRVMVDGSDLRTLDPVGFRSQVGLIPQHPVLFRGSVLDNLTLFRQGEIVDRAMGLAEQVGLADILAKLPRGFETPVGDAVVETLPEGVRQQIALVRALADEPPIILFDDPGAALDHFGDARLRTLLAACKGECTMIVVSNRPSLVELCSRHYRLAGGRLHRIDDGNEAADQGAPAAADAPRIAGPAS